MTHTVRLAVLLPLLLTSLLLIEASPAHADRCQPEELVTGPGSAPIPESADPKCPAFNEFVYPLVGCEETPTFAKCMSQVQADPAGTAQTTIGNVPNTPTYAVNTVSGTNSALKQFPAAAADAACVAAGGTPGREGNVPVCYQQGPPIE